MSTLKKIVVSDFRNITLQELEFSPNINCICGGNGQGKTNLLDAIWYLSMTKSALSPIEKFNFRRGTQAFALCGTYSLPDGRSTIISIQTSASGEKKLRRDDKPYPKISDHIGLFPIVIVSPSDTSMVSDGGEERRRFVNSVLSQTNREYLCSLQNYNRLLLGRNRLLKEGGADQGLLDIMDERMSALAGPVFEERRSFTERLLPLVRDYYSAISGDGESIDIKYSSDLENGASLLALLRSRRDRDSAIGYTTAGLQRDDFDFEIDGFPLRKCGSQGQQKSFLVALKFAQYAIMKERCGQSPILLLDDLFDKLDMDRVGNLLKMVSGSDFGQIFLSDSNKVRTQAIIDSFTSDRAYFEARDGSFSRL